MTIRNDAEYFTDIKTKLFSAVIGDILDTLGLRHQFLPPEIRGLSREMVAVGRAMPVLEADCFDVIETKGHNPLLKKPFGMMFEALDGLKSGEIYVCAGGTPRYAVWGELMSTRAKHLGAAGAICAGYCRDSNGILGLNFPTFSYGTFAQDQGPRGKVVDYHVAIEIGGVRITPGDLLFGDCDGVVVIPKTAENDVIKLALEKVATENKVRIAIEAGMSTVEAFERFGVM